MINTIQRVSAEFPHADRRNGIIHCQIMDEALQDRFRKLNLVAYVQPIFIKADSAVVDDCVGAELGRQSYNWRRYEDMGVHMCGGSDCPVELPDVMKVIQFAVTRTTLSDHTGPYLPEQALDIKQALDSYTAERASASFEERVKGRIAPGMLADFVILGANPFETAPEELACIPVEATYVDGVCRYSRQTEGKRQQEKTEKGLLFPGKMLYTL